MLSEDFISNIEKHTFHTTRKASQNAKMQEKTSKMLRPPNQPSKTSNFGKPGTGSGQRDTISWNRWNS
jgi:hypothetical protein